VKVLDFVSIYVKEMKKADAKFDSLHLIKGLLKAMQVAHADSNTILFDRIKTVLTNIARGNTQQAVSGDNKDQKILMTEVMGYVLKPTKD
jgi:hypothetical protein